MEVNTRMKAVIENIPLLPLRGLLVFPSMVLHIDVGRDRSIAALEEAMLKDSHIFLATQIDMRVEAPKQNDLYEIGTIANVKQMLKLPNGTLRILVEGISRAKLIRYVEDTKYTYADVEEYQDSSVKDPETEALMRALLTSFEKYTKMSNKFTAKSCT